jgi:AbrB family looped-hinge helix DNA binding protein
MAVSRVNTKGQVTIPKALRERLGFRPGDEIEFIEVEGGLRVQKWREGSPHRRELTAFLLLLSTPHATLCRLAGYAQTRCSSQPRTVDS